MCDRCNGMTDEELYQRTTDRILEFGQEVVLVDGGCHRFGYSIGMSMHDKPEFVIAGPLNPQVMHHIINKACDFAREEEIGPGYEFPPDTLLGGYPVRVVAVDPVESQMARAIEHFNEITALQLVWPDMDGNFPGEPNYDARFVQPVFALEEA